MDDVRGTLYHFVALGASPGLPEPYLLIKWVDVVGTFPEIVDLIGRPDYELGVDDRPLGEHRSAYPGWLVAGKTRNFHRDKRTVGVFIPEGMEDEVVERLNEEFRAVVFIPLALDELAQMTFLL
ncbi:MAG: hypothetical protein WC858_02295 [Parcubacteria group bacterium]|jgi:hypothetical protein